MGDHGVGVLEMLKEGLGLAVVGLASRGEETSPAKDKDGDRMGSNKAYEGVVCTGVGCHQVRKGN